MKRENLKPIGEFNGLKTIVKFESFDFDLLGIILKEYPDNIFMINVIYKGSSIIVYRTFKELNFI